jgi:hypothetical protein
LFSARVARKFLTVSPVAPEPLASSATMALLSETVSVGIVRMETSFVSFCSRALRAATPLAVGSREAVLTAAVYYLESKMTQVSCGPSIIV